MKTYILFLLFSGGFAGSTGGHVNSGLTQEFNSQATCEYAAQLAMTKANNSGRIVYWAYCTPK